MAEHVATTPSGLAITFEDGSPDPVTGKSKRRSYLVDGEKFPSITTVTGQYEKPGLVWAAEKLTVDGCLALAAEGALPTYTPAALSALGARELRYRQVWDATAARGTLTHSDQLAFARGEEPVDLDDVLPEERGFIRGLAAFQLEHEPRALLSEFMVASPLGFAGRPDFLGELPRFRDGQGLLEIKTTKEIPRYKDGTPKPPYLEHVLQLSGQSQGCIDSGYPTPEWAAVLRVEASGDFVLSEVPIRHESFLAALKSYNLNREHMAEAREMAKAVRV